MRIAIGATAVWACVCLLLSIAAADAQGHGPNRHQRHGPPPLLVSICTPKHQCWDSSLRQAPREAYRCAQNGGKPVFIQRNRHRTPRYDHCRYPRRQRHLRH